MIDFIEYVVSELKSQRLSKENALALIEQFSSQSTTATGIHPLLQRNTSDLTRQNYTTTYTGKEFFLRDHIVQGNKVLPAVAYLEMVRAAMADAGTEQKEKSILELRNVAWAQPVVVSENKEISLALYASNEQVKNNNDQVDFEIYSSNGIENCGGNDIKNEIIHCQGQVVFMNQPSPPRCDLDSLRLKMQKGRLESVDVYSAIANLGINIGPSHQGVKTIYQGDKQQLVHICLPDVVKNTYDDYVLHPSIIDSLLQSATGLITDLIRHFNQPPIPFALESLQLHSTCTKEMFAWARYAAGNQAEDKVVKLDIDLYDTKGNVCVSLRGFSSRIFSPEIDTVVEVQNKGNGRLLAVPEWKYSDASSMQHEKTNTAYNERHIILCGFSNIDANKIEATSCLQLQLSQHSIADRYMQIALACFKKIRTILEKLQDRAIVQLVIANQSDLTLVGLASMLKTATLENPNLNSQVIITNAEIVADELSVQLRESENRPHEKIIKYEHDQRHVIHWQAIDESKTNLSKAKIAFKEQGVYLITGGLGGLGLVFSREILQQTNKAKIILTGRSVLAADYQALLDDLCTSDKKQSVLYRQLDIADLDQVKQLVSNLTDEFGTINGIIHCAGMISDAFILKKTPEEFVRVLEPKVTGTYNLDQACQDLNLDFFVLFSAGAAVHGNAGQADYAAANGFMDQFAVYRNSLVSKKTRKGHTVAINWPLWQEGGMSIDPVNQKVLQRTTGMVPLKTPIGIDMFYQCLEMTHNQILAVEGDVDKLHRALLTDIQQEARILDSERTSVSMLADTNTSNLAGKTQKYLCNQFSKVLKLPSHKIDPRASLDKYGIDSILAMELTSQLEKTFGSLPKTLFFEYQTIRELSGYFIKSYSIKLNELFVEQNISSSEKKLPETLLESSTKSSRKSFRVRESRNRLSPNKKLDSSILSTDPIAIIGLSGQYPEAPDIETYWCNLRDGKDCIIEVPKKRWDWEEHFTEDRTKNGYHYSKWGGFIEGVDEFDPLFFNISPREAHTIDPQERLFLQHAWQAVEDAAYTRDSLQVPHKHGLAGQVGVYVGVMYGEYNLSGSLASIANRVSHVFNLHGPSMTLDTMCSSSLTTIHLACQDLKLGRTDIAIVGGVNISIHPSKYLMLSAGQFISSDGHCQSFGEGGDGYIPGEGVGVFVLKRLSEAESSGDHIYGVIKGSATNHGGKTNGYTVPNPIAQSSVISQALAESNTNPHHISYIEAHGTGTKLGDPIEIAALSKAFHSENFEASPQSNEFGFCALGSVKSNVGHCESAAGVAGLTKVLLQLQHRQIVPSLHSEKLNPYIDFENSPFVVNQTLKDWERPVIDGREVPRIAGISSFGAGGSNAHIIVEEYIPLIEVKQPTIHAPVIIPLSARTAEQLQQRVHDLLNFVRTHQQIDLLSMAFTLQVGREALDERLGIIVSSIEQLAKKLQAYIDDKQGIEGVFRGQVKNQKETLSLLSEDIDFQETVDKWIARKNLSKILDLWVKGLDMNWHKFYGEDKPRRISLPTYPFAKDKYWIETVGQVVTSAISHPAVTTNLLHPLIHSNTSTLSEQSYSSIFKGEEPFLFGNQIKGQKVLPAAAYLEMAHAAVIQSSPTQASSSLLELHNIVWGQAMVVSADRKVTVALFTNEDDQIEFEIASHDNECEIIHCQGQAILSKQSGPAVLDVPNLRARMQQNHLDNASLYSSFVKMNLHYDEAHQVITTIHKGMNELFAELKLPPVVATSQDEFFLHPNLMDGALQVCVALGNNVTPSSPFSLDSIRIVSKCEEIMLVWVRFSQGDERGKLDIDLCDVQGNVCVQMRGLLPQQSTVAVENQISVVLEAADNIALQIESVAAKPKSIELLNLHDADYVENTRISLAERNSVSLTTLSKVDATENVLSGDSHFIEKKLLDADVSKVEDSTPGDDEPKHIISFVQLQQQLRSSLADSLYMQISDIDNEKSFVDLGLDSIVGVEWVKVINKQYDLSIAASRVYDYPNIKELALFLEKEISKQSTSNQPVARSVKSSLESRSKTIGESPISNPVSETATQARISVPVKQFTPSSSSNYPILKKRPRADRISAKSHVSSQTNRVNDDEKIAIIGMSGRYPQAENLKQYWDNLACAKNSVVEIPQSRWDIDEYYDPDPTKLGKIYCKWMGMLDDIDRFDPLFFQISPAEAENMDPQHRIFMQEAYRAFEDAGYSNTSLSNNKCGVYLGIMSNEYSMLISRNNSFNVDATGTSYAIAAARMAYYLNLKGPAVPIDTACSSSLVAIHLACQGLLNREMDMALAGGVSLYITPDSYLAMCQAGMLSPYGQCKTFDNSADGFVPGEGVGALILKRLQDAERDHDSIYGVILGSGINQDGKTNGITAPSVNSQIELKREVYSRYKIDPETVSYIEAHGTGTKLGDPIELEALATVFSEKTSKKNYCALGSVKTNIGHTSGAAGVASVQKILLSMKNQTLVPSLNLSEENTHFDFENSPFYICREKQPWKETASSPRRAGVSSFGFSGTNAHLVIEEYVDQKKNQTVSAPVQSNNSPFNKEVPILLSARTPDQLRQKVLDLLEFLAQGQQAEDIDLLAMAYTLQVGRESWKERLGFMAGTINQLSEKLQAYIAGEENIEGIYKGRAARDQNVLAEFNASTNLQETIDNLFTNRKFKNLLDLWVKGLEIDWSKFYPENNRPKRISLPTYPFAKERYWIPTSLEATVSLNSKDKDESIAKLEQAEEKQRLSYIPNWKNSAINKFDYEFLRLGPILVINASDQLCLALKYKLADAPIQPSIILLTYGDSFQEITPNSFTINIEQQEDYYKFIELLKKRGQLPSQVVHHCRIENIFDETDTFKNNIKLSSLLNDNVYMLFKLCKAFMANKHNTQLRIISVFASNPNTIAPQNAALAGFFKTLMLENPKYLTKLIDIRSPDNEPVPIQEISRVTIDELKEKNWLTTEVRYQQLKNGHNYIRHVKEFVLYKPENNLESKLPLKQNGVYIITGGLGGLGFIFSEYLARDFHAKLILLGRSTLTAAQKEKLHRLQSHQAEIYYLQADVSKLSDVERVIQDVKTRHDVINGVIHAAGVNKDSFILNKTMEEMESVLAPKVLGAVNLDCATSREDLDLFVMFSSVAATTGNPGQADYAYGNHFLDSFAENRESLKINQKRSGKTLSINWPYWQEGGMTLSQSDVISNEARTGLSPLPTKQGIRYWEEFLSSDILQAVALYGISSKITSYVAQQSPRIETKLTTGLEIDSSDTARLLAKTDAYLKQLIGDEIKLSPDRIDSDEGFESFGIDSIVIGRLNITLERDLGVLPKTIFYEYETIAELAKYLVQESQQKLINFFRLEISTNSTLEQTDDIQAEGNSAKSIGYKSHTIEKQDEPEKIAIIGVQGYYPQSEDLDEYWENLRQGKDLVSVIPENRWDCEALYDPDPNKAVDGKIYCKWGAFLEDFDKFDSPFFNIPTAEAQIIDPQERLFLQSVWIALEDAGYTRESLKRSFPKSKSAGVGVFVGVTTNSYNLLVNDEWKQGNMSSPAALPWSIANRVSYFFDFQGPSFPVDTACSSSLVAIHQACESLRRQECELAVAGGVNLYLHPAKYLSLCQRRMLSQHGKCRSFGAGDDGFVPGEGIGTLILKPLRKAIQQGDHIYGVVLASACNHSGRSNGYSAPNPNSQASLISDTLRQARIHPETISYIEGHGTGTQLGDSLEIVALSQAFRKYTKKQQFCSIGSVKANLGHSESAAGIAGVTKILLQMKHRQLVPSIHSDTVNPNIEFESSPFQLQHELREWEQPSLSPRRALINSFGAGGVNACILLEEYEHIDNLEQPNRIDPHLIVISARNEERLLEYVDKLLCYLRKEVHTNIADLSYTLQLGREAMPERLAIVVKDVQELIRELEQWHSTSKPTNNIHRGSLDPRKGAIKSSKEKQNEVRNLLETNNLVELAKQWISGVEVKWEELYSQNCPMRIPLPTYPFAKERYWISDSTVSNKYLSIEQNDLRLHPLLTFNSSTLKDVIFSSLLSDSEFYACDHTVNGEKIFPGSGFLEMACVSGAIAGVKKVSKIRDVVWVQPLVIKDKSQMVQILLKQKDNNAEYNIISYDQDREKVIHSEGTICFQEEINKATSDEEVISIESLIAQCPNTVDGEHYYRLFKESGINYGPAFQTIQELHIGSSYALSKLKIANHLMMDFNQYILHPSIIDGALQTVSGLLSGVDSSVPYLPFAIEEVDIAHSTSPSSYVYVEQSGSEKQGSAEVKKFNIKILNEKGLVLVTFKKFCVRAFNFTTVEKQLASS